MATFTVSASADDWIWNTNSTFSATDPIGCAVFESSGGTQSCGCRFDNITIPNGATINSAKVTFVEHTYASLGDVDIKIGAFSADDPAAPVDQSEASGTTRVAQNVSWTPTDHTTNASFDTPSLVTIIQALVNRVGWASGNAMVLTFDTTSSDLDEQRWYSYDTDNAKAPVLTIVTPTTYNETGSGGVKVNGSAGLSLLDNPELVCLSDGLVAYYPLEDGDDLVGGHDLTNINTTFGTGQVDNCAIFNGTDAKLTHNDDITVFGDEGGTITFWAKIVDNTGIQGLICMFNDMVNLEGFEIFVSNIDTICLLMANGNNHTSDLQLTEGEWTFVALRASPISLTQCLAEIRVNDSAWDTQVLNLDALTPSTHQFIVGSLNAGAYFEGEIDELALWSRPLNDDEIDTVYALGLDGLELSYQDICVAGGVVCSGTSGITAVYNISASGGMVCGGFAPTIYRVIGSGGSVCAGTSTIEVVYSASTSGGVKLAGFGRIGYDDYGSGGVKCAGSATVQKIMRETSTGGVVMSKWPFKYRVTITVPSGKVGSNLDKFYLGVRCQIDPDHVETGTDFYVTRTNYQPLDFELREWDDGDLTIFIKRELASGSDNKAYLFYGEE